MSSDPGQKFQTKLKVAETQFRAAMEEFLKQQQTAYAEMMMAMPVNAEASPKASSVHGAAVLASEPLLQKQHEHYHEVYSPHIAHGRSRGDLLIIQRAEAASQEDTWASRIAEHVDVRHEKVREKWFQMFSMALVFSMCAHLTLDVHCDMKHSLFDLIRSKHEVTENVMHHFFDDGNIDSPLFEGWKPPYCEGNGMTIWKVANLIAFSVEICVRVFHERGKFCSTENRWWNGADVALWIVNVMEFGSKDLLGIRFDARWKAVNVLRMLRILRLFLYFPTLANMMYSLLACKKALICAVFFIFFYTMGFSIFFMQVALYYVEKHKDEMRPTEFESIVGNWNGVFDSVMSLVYAVTGGTDWKELAQPFFHMGATGWPGWPGHILGTIWLACFTSYVVFTTMGLLNVLVGIFVSQAENLANVSVDYAIETAGKKMDEREEDASMLFSKIQDLTKKRKNYVEPDSTDSDCANEEGVTDDEEGVTDDDSLTVEQIVDACNDKKIRSLYAYLDIDLMNPVQMLKTFDHNRNNKVDRHEFITGCMRLRGPAKPVEVQAILELVVQMNTKLNDMVLADRRPVTAPIH